MDAIGHDVFWRLQSACIGDFVGGIWDFMGRRAQPHLGVADNEVRGQGESRSAVVDRQHFREPVDSPIHSQLL